MRHLAIRFRGLLRGGTSERLDAWLIDARASGIYAMQRFARTIRQDLDAVRKRCVGTLEQRADRRTERVVDGSMAGEESLRGAGALEPLHLALPPPRRLMRILSSVVLPSPPFVPVEQRHTSSRACASVSARHACFAW